MSWTYGGQGGSYNSNSGYGGGGYGDNNWAQQDWSLFSFKGKKGKGKGGGGKGKWGSDWQNSSSRRDRSRSPFRNEADYNSEWQYHEQWNPNNQFETDYHMDPYEIPYDAPKPKKKKKGSGDEDLVEVRADYSQEFVDSGERPQNFLRDVPYLERYNEYPKLQRLMTLKDEIIAKRATPPVSLKTDLKTFDLASMGQFDVIVIDPPWEEYQNRVADTHVRGEDLTPWTLDEIANLRIVDIAAPTCFLYLWCGVAHLEQARILFKRWGFKRCEDICWVKTNKRDAENGTALNTMYNENSVLVRTKEHCLMGIRGAVKRNNDGDLIHANCDTDVIIAEEPREPGSTEKPEELYSIIEHFCLARKRIELFGLDRNIRDGWVTVGRDISRSNWDYALYHSWFAGEAVYPEVQGYQGGRLLGTITEVEQLRPKSPPRGAMMLEDGTVAEGKGGKGKGKPLAIQN